MHQLQSKRMFVFFFNKMLYLNIRGIRLVWIYTTLNKSWLELVPESIYASANIKPNRSEHPSSMEWCPEAPQPADAVHYLCVPQKRTGKLREKKF